MEGVFFFFFLEMINSVVEIVLLQKKCFSGLEIALDYIMLENRFILCIGLNSDKVFFRGVNPRLCNFSLTQWSIFLITLKKF